MKHLLSLVTIGTDLALSSCKSGDNELANIDSKILAIDSAKPPAEFQHVSEQFADLRVLRYNMKDFEKLTPQVKELLYYLYEAALSGRDIIYDQNYKHNLTIRKTIEAIMDFYTDGN